MASDAPPRRPPLLIAGLDSRSLPLEAPLLRREGHVLLEQPSGAALVEALAATEASLVVLGPRLPEPLPAVVRRIRADPLLRRVSILTLLPRAEPELAELELKAVGCNAVLRRPLDTATLEAWIAKLLAVPRRVEARVPVQGRVIGEPKLIDAARFEGLTRNISVNGLLLASPVPIERSMDDVELEIQLEGSRERMRALGRIVRDAPEVGWPYRGYGVEFLFLPPASLEALRTLVTERLQPPQPAANGRSGIHSTLPRATWIYELREPVPAGQRWNVEIRRAPRERWRPGVGGPFYVVSGGSPSEALESAREFVRRHG